ncbi:MAG: putative Zn-dependent peptidase [bacterium]|nr:MAG: putative Zn-dependent peptidase [bacterium]
MFPILTYSQPTTTQITPSRDKLLNGLPIIVLPRSSSGSVAIHIVIKSGATFDLVNKAGLADLTSQMIYRGTNEFTSEQFREELEFIGAKLQINTYWDSTEIRMLGSSSKLEAMIKLLNQILTQPKFPQAELEQLKSEHLKAIEIISANGDDNFYNTLYGLHPYGHNIIGTKDSISKITRGDILDFYNRFYLANNSVLIIAGDTTVERVLPGIKKGLGGWRKGNPPPYTFVPPASQSGINIRLKELANSTMAEIRLGYFTLKRNDPNYLATRLLVDIFNDRLSKHPEWKAKATLSARKLTSTFLVSASTANTTATETISTLIDEAKKLGSIDTTELQKAKEKLQEEYYDNLNSNTELAARWAELENYNLGSNYIKDFSLIVSRISTEDLQQVAIKHLSTDNLLISVMGRTNELEPSLKKLGKVEILTDVSPSKTESPITQPNKVEQNPIK